MKARMSQSVSRLDDVMASDPLVREYAAEVALEELREIMAEVEPERPAGAPGAWYGFEDIRAFVLAEQRYGVSTNGSVRRALAESLATFVED